MCFMEFSCSLDTVPKEMLLGTFASLNYPGMNRHPIQGLEMVISIQDTSLEPATPHLLGCGCKVFADLVLADQQGALLV